MRREVLVAALLCALAATAFLGSALFTGKYLSPADLLFGDYPWSSHPPPGWSGASNDLLGDDVTQFEPWLQYSEQRLRSGHIPLWNPDNMLGAPLVGNMQSAVFYPANWLYFIFPGAFSLAMRAWLKLFIAALGMYLLARRVAGVGPLGAAIASVGFSFGAFMTVWLLHPHTAVAAWLPWLWLATSALIGRQTARRLWLVAAVAAVVAVIILAGHPETAYEIALVTGLFVIFLLWRQRSQGWAYLVRGFGLWAGACFIGVCLAAVQILPFVEYLQNSASTLLRGSATSAQAYSLPAYYAWTMISPDLYGNPAHHDWWGPQANYNEANMYCGVLVILLALFAPLARERPQRQLSLFLLAFVGLAAAVVFNVPVLRQALVTATFTGLMATQRLTLVIEFALALLAGLGAHGLHMWVRQHRSARLALYLGAASLLLLLAGLVIPWLFAHSFFHLPDTLPENMLWQSGLLRALGLLLFSSALIAPALWLQARARGRETGTGGVPAVARTSPVPGAAASILLWCLPLILFVDLLGANAGYLPTISPPNRYPPTAVTTFLQSQQPQFRSVATVWTLLPDTNLMYGVPDVRGYDALEPLLYHNLIQAADSTIRRNAQGGFRPIHSLESHILDALNVRYVVSEPGANPNFKQDVSQDGSGADQVTPPLVSGHTAGQTFVARQDNLADIQVFGSTTGPRPAGSLVFHLKTSPADPTDLITSRLDVASLQDNSWWDITFQPIQQARGKQFYFYLEAPGTSGSASDGGGNMVRLGYTPGNPYGGGARMQDGKPADGDLLFGAYSFVDAANPRFNLALPGGPHDASVFENVRALPRAWLVHRVEVQTEEDKRLGRLADPTFDLSGAAMLSASLPGRFALPGDTTASRGDDVRVTDYEPERVQVTTSSRIAGLLVLSDEQFPGWEASVDGQEAPILTADEALRSVYVPAGSHTITFVYRPVSFQVGAAVSIIGLLIVLALLGWDLSARARRARPGALDVQARGEDE